LSTSTDKKKEAIALLAQGATQAQVARSLSISRQAVSLWLKSETFRDEVEKARKIFLTMQHEQEKLQLNNLVEKVPIPISKPGQTFKCAFREKELLFLEEIQRCLMPQLLEGNLRAANALIKISERRSKLYGLDLKPYEILEALQILVDEGCAPKSQILIVTHGLDQIQERLRSSMDAIPIEDG
jgi:transcriptional regulator with XRE-family HTH domain